MPNDHPEECRESRPSCARPSGRREAGGDSAAYTAAMQFLLGRVNYERALAVPYGNRGFKLDRMRQLLARLGDPQEGLPILHVAGTKGKGSTSTMIGSVLSAAGYRTGLFTSPHLDRVEQRIAIDAQPCSAEDLVELVARVRPSVEAMDRLEWKNEADENWPTYFEITTAMALLHFADCRVDAAILEVGLGGRLDSTNICLPRVSVITSISLDHTRQLGNTLTLIAGEKAGIIKPGVPVVSGVVQDEPREVVRQVCRRQGSPLVELGVDFDFQYRPPRHLEQSEQSSACGLLDYHYRPRERDGVAGTACEYLDVPLRMPGRHQATNASIALAALSELWPKFEISAEAIRTGLAQAVCPARVEVVGYRPTVVIDAAHNRASIEALVATLDECFHSARRLLLFAASQEKDLQGMLQHLLERFDHVILTRYSDNPRAVPPEEMAALAVELTGRPCTVCADPAVAWETIRGLASPEDLICVTGSFFIAGEIRRRLTPPPA